MESNDKSLESKFNENLKLKYNELIGRNSEKLALCEESNIETVRRELLDTEYHGEYTFYGKGMYAREMYGKIVDLKKRFSKATFDERFRMAKSDIKEFSLGSNDQILKWLDQSDETLVKEMAEYAAWLSVMGYSINASDLFIEENTFNDEEISHRKDLRKNTYRFKWTGSDEQLLKLYKNLQIVKNSNDKGYYESNYIDCPDFKLFEKHFSGKKLKRKIIWIRTFYELVYLLDNLCYYMDNSAYHKSKDMIMPDVVSQHFEIKRDQENLDLSKQQSYSDARSRFSKNLKLDFVRRKKKEKLDIIIQELN